MSALLYAGVWSAFAASQPDARVAPVVSQPVKGPLRIVVVGDTGVVHKPNADPCGEVGTSCKLSIDGAAQLWASVKAEDAHAAFLTGDLIYGSHRIESAPRCRKPDGRVKERWLDPALGDKVRELGIPVYLSLGNHDTGHQNRSRARERCLLRYAETEPALHMPQLNYVVDFGLARLVVLDTNIPPSKWPEAAFASHEAPWTLMGGHHVVRTHFDKASEHAIRDWLVDTDQRPDLWVNGHAHFLQFGVYEGIPAATSGGGAKIRVRPQCPGKDCQGADAPLYSRSTFGYAVVEITDTTLRLSFKDAAGDPLFCWERDSDDAAGRACSPDHSRSD